MKWKNPFSESSSTLYLPVLQKQAVPDVTHIDVISPDIAIHTAPSFRDVWCNGPKNESPEELLRCICELGDTFSELIRQKQNNVRVSTKQSTFDLVTEMDMGIEMLFRLWINRFFPAHKVIGEEGYKDVIHHTDTVWYIDPIDGTTNFVEGGLNVTVHLGCVRAGLPYVSYVGVPFQYYSYAGCIGGGGVRKAVSDRTGATEGPDHGGTPVFFPYPPPHNEVGTEFLTSNTWENGLFHRVTQKLQTTGHRYKSIGINLLSVLEGKQAVFYKPDVKYWDIIAPLSLIYFAHSASVAIDLLIPETPGERLTRENALAISPFSDLPVLIDHLNCQREKKCRIGFLAVYPLSRPEVRDVIVREFFAAR